MTATTTAPRLTKGMYAAPPISELFGLRQGQCRSNDFVHNGGWYNKQGEKLGWGDLEPADILRIRNQLEDDEMFVVLPEGASFWAFGKDVGSRCLAGGVDATHLEQYAPGVDYMVENAKYVIARHKIYDLRDFWEVETYVDEGLQFHTLTPDKFKEMLTAK